MSEKSESQLSLFQTSSAEGSHVKTCRLPEKGRAWLEAGQDSSSSLHELCLCLNQNSFSWKMYPGFSQAMRGETLPLSFDGWKNSGIYRHGECLTVSISEWPRDAAVCSLSEVLEMEVAPKYYLSPKACSGILRRAEKRGKELPPMLKTALLTVATSVKTNEFGYQEDICRGLRATDYKSPPVLGSYRMTAFGEYADDNSASALKRRDYKDATDLVCYENHPADSRVKEVGNTMTALTERMGTGGGNVPLVQNICFQQNTRDEVREIGGKIAGCISADNGSLFAHNNMAVRRLTPRECERLQGFPDDWTRYGIDENGKKVTISDTQRYKMMGNAVTVSVAEWIGKRIAKLFK